MMVHQKMRYAKLMIHDKVALYSRTWIMTKYVRMVGTSKWKIPLPKG